MPFAGAVSPPLTAMPLPPPIPHHTLPRAAPLCLLCVTASQPRANHGVLLLALEAPSGTDPVLPHDRCWSPAPNAVEPASPPKNLMAEGPCSSMPWPPYPLGPLAILAAALPQTSTLWSSLLHWCPAASLSLATSTHGPLRGESSSSQGTTSTLQEMCGPSTVTTQ